MMRLFLVLFFLLSIGVLAADANNTKDRDAGVLYRKYCISCHGSDGRSKTSKGKFNHARDLTNAEWQDDVSDERIFNSIMNGRDVAGTMPPFHNKINQKEAESLVNFVRKFRGK
jgi:mono/diheme cytochrome c family protein